MENGLTCGQKMLKQYMENGESQGDTPKTGPLKLWQIRKSMLEYKCKIDYEGFCIKYAIKECGERNSELIGEQPKERGDAYCGLCCNSGD